MNADAVKLVALTQFCKIADAFLNIGAFVGYVYMKVHLTHRLTSCAIIACVILFFHSDFALVYRGKLQN